MNELSLFAGAGGGLLGTHLLGWTPVGYVEINDYCQRVLAQRIKDGYLPDASIFGDIRAFIDTGCAKLYRGVADVITAGFPCQPFSVAGKQRGADDDRNMWPATIATIRAVRPRFAFLENVLALVTSGYFPTILGDLAESGYDARWCVLGARHVGGCHRRDRLWLLAHPTGERWSICDDPKADKMEWKNMETHIKPGHRWRRENGRHSMALGWRSPEPGICISDDDVADRMDRLKALGNGQVPAVVRAAWNILSGEIDGQ